MLKQRWCHSYCRRIGSMHKDIKFFWKNNDVFNLRLAWLCINASRIIQKKYLRIQYTGSNRWGDEHLAAVGRLERNLVESHFR